MCNLVLPLGTFAILSFCVLCAIWWGEWGKALLGSFAAMCVGLSFALCR